MKRVVILVFVALVAWQIYSQFRAGALVSYLPLGPVPVSAAPAAPQDFKCDGRTNCSHMTSCAEAKFFQKNCRDTDLAVDSAGLPCPQRWCTSPDAP